jgi:ATP-dependent DNA helicase RecG
MLRLLKHDGLPGPQFRESGLFFKIIIYKKKKLEETTIETAAKTSGESEKRTTKALSEEDIDTSGEITEEKGTTIKTTIKTTTETTIKIHGKLLKLIKAKPSIRIIELAERMHLTKDGVWYHLKKLKEAGILNRVGPTKGGYWKINEDRIPKSIT